MSDPEIEHLRKSLDELRQMIYDRDHDQARELGYLTGWRETIGPRLDRIETRLDTLLFSLLDERRQKATAGKHPARPKTTPQQDVPAPSGNAG
jgi:hypothetical protein